MQTTGVDGMKSIALGVWRWSSYTKQWRTGHSGIHTCSKP
jgi:hypothetical protein